MGTDAGIIQNFVVIQRTASTGHTRAQAWHRMQAWFSVTFGTCSTHTRHCVGQIFKQSPQLVHSRGSISGNSFRNGDMATSDAWNVLTQVYTRKIRFANYFL